MMKRFVSTLLAMALVLTVCADAETTGPRQCWNVGWSAGGAMGMRFTDVVADEDGPVLSLWPRQDLAKVRVELMGRDPEQKVTVLYEGENVSSNDVLNVQVMPGAAPQLRVTSIDAEGREAAWYVWAREADGVLCLMPAGEESEWPFAALEGLSFVFASGVGAWGTSLEIDEAGRFSGIFSDAEMGDASEDYPYGTEYWSQFEGVLGMAWQVNDYAWELTIREQQTAEEVGSERIEDGIRYVASEPYGMADAGSHLRLYLPGAPVSELPEGFMAWSHLYDGEGYMVDALPGYALYNVTEDAGFIAWSMADIR